MSTEFNFAARLKKLSEKIFSGDVEGILISKPENIFYLSGFRGDSTILFVTKNFRKLITDGRYTEQAEQQAKNFEIIKQNDGLFKKVAEEVKKSGAKKICFESAATTFNEYKYLRKNLTMVELQPGEVDSLRQVKDEKEISLIRRACEIADKAFAEILNFIRPGLREFEVAAELEYLMRKFGSEKAAFDTIAASGIRGSLPHGTASDKKIFSGEFLTLDFGAVFEGYHSDITRTVCVGKADERQKKIYSVVSEAQLHGLEVIKAGVSGKAADAAVRKKISDAGFGEYFSHALGHSVGLEIHEEPRLSRLSPCERLEPGTVLTDEPGIYIPDFGGVRIEDTVLVKNSGAEVLTKSPKNLIEL